MSRNPSIPPPTGTPDPEKLCMGYRWPASRITKADMVKLAELREVTDVPITQLLHEAVGAYYRMLTSLDSTPK